MGFGCHQAHRTMGFLFLSLYKERIHMELFYQQPKPDPQKTRETVSKGYGIQNPERVLGFAGAFLFHVPDVYISDTIASRLKLNPTFKDDLLTMLERFCTDDYGFVTFLEQNSNNETRYLCGSSTWMIARYGSRFGGVVFETFYDLSLLYFVEEDVDDIWNLQELKRQAWCRRTGPDPAPWTRHMDICYCPEKH